MNPQSNIQILLSQKFNEIKSRNQRFSVRAFARQLGLQASATNEIMKGQRKVSRDLAMKITERLKLSTDERNSLLKSYEDKTQVNLSFAVGENELQLAMEILKKARKEIDLISQSSEKKVIELTVILAAFTQNSK